MHMQPVFANIDFVTADGKVSRGAELYMKSGSENADDRSIDTSVSADIFTRGLCLPSDIKNTDEIMREIIEIVRSCF